MKRSAEKSFRFSRPTPQPAILPRAPRGWSRNGLARSPTPVRTIGSVRINCSQEKPLAEIGVPDQEDLDAGFGAYLAWHPAEPWLAVGTGWGTSSERGIWLIHTI